MAILKSLVKAESSLKGNKAVKPTKQVKRARVKASTVSSDGINDIYECFEDNCYAIYEIKNVADELVESAQALTKFLEKNDEGADAGDIKAYIRNLADAGAELEDLTGEVKRGFAKFLTKSSDILGK